MKYIKYTTYIFIAAIVFTCIDTSAYQQWYNYAAIEIPAFNGYWQTTKTKSKDNYGNQLMYETGATESGTAVTQPMAATVIRNTDPVRLADRYVALKKDKNVILPDSATVGSYHLKIKVDKWVLLPTYFSGTWVVDQ